MKRNDKGGIALGFDGFLYNNKSHNDGWHQHGSSKSGVSTFLGQV
jgi:hypothetical protein